MHRRGFLATTAVACLARGIPAAGALSRQIKITGLETDLLRFPPGKPEFNATQRFGPNRGGVVVRLLADAGITEWMEIAAISDGFGLELASHGGGATNMNMLLAMSNAIYIESGSVKNTSQKMIHGEILGPSEPGMSSDLDRSYIARYKVG
jgi:hypothetical protein